MAAASVACLLGAAGCSNRAGARADAAGSARPAALEEGAPSSGGAAASSRARVGGPVLVELFTSEGCSSCPPADELLARLVDDPGVIGLSFHVDYWNEIGWPDPFSDAQFTRRQRWYATHFSERGMYTPQMVVGGEHAFVGSRESDAEASIARVRRRGDRGVKLALRGGSSGPDAAKVSFAIEGAPAGAKFVAALVASRVEQRVPRGENAGRTLEHVNVVRSLVELVAEPKGEATLPVRGGREAPRARKIVGFVQDATSFEVLAVSETRVGDDEAR